MTSSIDRGRQLYRASRTTPDHQASADATETAPPTEPVTEPGEPSVARGRAMWAAGHPWRATAQETVDPGAGPTHRRRR
jgi:hypothetical protein